MTIVFILLFIFIIWPIIRVAWTVHRLRSQARKAYEQMYQQATGQGDRPAGNRSRKAGWSRPDAMPAKKIHREDGEFVSFEEIKVASADYHTSSSSSTSSARYTNVKIEQQIEDADWEEV